MSDVVGNGLMVNCFEANVDEIEKWIETVMRASSSRALTSIAVSAGKLEWVGMSTRWRELECDNIIGTSFDSCAIMSVEERLRQINIGNNKNIVDDRTYTTIAYT